MLARTPREIFVMLLLEVGQGTQNASKIYHEISERTQDPQIKEALETRAFVSEKTLATLDECLRLMSEQPVKLTDRPHDVFLQDLPRQLADIQYLAARHLFLLAKLNQFTPLRIGEYMALMSAADRAGHDLVDACYRLTSTMTSPNQRPAGQFGYRLIERCC
jgi:ferritin-like metal-binding protein YciE